MRINPNGLIHGVLILAMASLTACGGGGGGSTDSATTTYTIGGSVTGLSGTVVLQNNGGDNLSVSANGAFTFATGLAGGATYSITVLTQPAGQICSVNPYSGTVAAANVTSVAVTCAAIANTYTVGGSVSGLTGTGLVLQNNGGDDLPVAAGASTFTFSTALASGATYAVTVKTQPAGQTCTVNPYTGTVSANVINVGVTCTTSTPLPTAFTVGGNVTGLTGTGLVLRELARGENLSITGNGNFTFLTQFQSTDPYIVQILTPPAGQICSLVNELGTVSGANVTNISVTCSANTFSIGGTISGLTSDGLVLQNNGGDDLPVAADATGFIFPTQIANGAPYSVTVQTQPTGQTCSVTNGAGTVSGAVTNVSVNCSTGTYPIGVTVSGLNGTVVLQNNVGDNLSITANGSFAFSTPLPFDSGYSVSVLTQPTLPQICMVANASGVVGVATNVNVTCVNAYTISGTIFGAADGVGPILQNNLGDNLFIPAITTTGTSFIFTTPIADGGTYSITQLVRARAPSQTCTATTNGSGPVAGANVDTVVVTCSLSTITPSFAYVTNSTANITSGAADTASAFAIGVDGTLTAATPSTTASGDQPYAVAVEPTGQFAYVVNLNDDSVSVYNIGADGVLASVDADGSMTDIQPTIATGDAPMSIAIHPSGKFVYIVNSANTTAGNTLSAYSIDVTTGALTAIDADGATLGMQSSIATGAVPYAVAVDPLGRFAYVANKGDGTVSAYTINDTTGALTPVGTVVAGTGPSSIAVDPTGKCALVANNTSDDVMSYTIDQVTGGLTAPLTVAGAAGSNPRSVAIDPNTGWYAYVANAGSDSVSALSITPSTCAIAAVNADGVTTALTIAAGATPMSVNVDPSGQFVYVANYSSNDVSVYRIGAGGALTPLTPIATGSGPTSVTTTE